MNGNLLDTYSAMESVGIGIHWVDADSGRFLYVNKFAADLLGYSALEMLDMVVPDIDPSFRDLPFRQATESFRHQQGKKFETKAKSKDGSLIPAEVTVHYLPPKDGIPARFISFLTDITERKKAELALMTAIRDAEMRRSDVQYQTVIQASLDGFCVINSSGQILDANDSICRKLGYTREELLRLCIADIDADELSRETAVRIRRIVVTGHDLFETRHKCKDGAIINVEVSVQRVPELGDRLFVFIRDTTERKRAEADLRIAAKAFGVQDAIIITDENARILRVNKSFTRITGYSESIVVGNTPALLKSGRQDDHFYKAMWEVLKRDHYWQGEIWNRRSNGEVYPELLSITAVCDESGGVTNYIGTFTDISKFKEADEKIRQLAFYDPLTGLPNRRLLYERLQHTLAATARHESYCALLFIDLDREFKFEVQL